MSIATLWETSKPKVEYAELSDTYGKFVVEPLERGFGVTLGNSLRRVLLSSIEGAAVTSVKIEGVLHEFSTIPGVVEDVTQIILNLKELTLKLHTDKPKLLRLEAAGKKEVTAGYVPAERHRKSEHVIGVIPVDSIFSPIQKVNYAVEDTRVGQMTDFDRLVFEVWTDG